MGNNLAIAAVIAIIVANIYIYSGIRSYAMDKNNNVKKIYLFITLTLAAWSICIALMNTTEKVELALMYRNVAAVFWVLLFPLTVHIYILLGSHTVTSQKKFPLYLPLYIPSIIFYYFLYFVKPYRTKDFIATSFGWAYLNQKPYNIDIYLFFYGAIYLTIFFILSYKYYKASAFKRQKKAVEHLSFGILLSFSIGAVTDILIPIFFPTIHIVPLAYAAELILVLDLCTSIKNHLSVSFDSPIVLSEIVKNVKDGIIVTNTENVIGFANQNALDIFGFSSHDNIKNLHFPNGINDFLPSDKKIKSENKNGNEILELLTNNYKSEFYEIKTTIISDDFAEDFAKVYIIKDITAKLEAEKELKQSNQMLEYLVDERTKELQQKQVALTKEIEMRTSAEKQITWLAYNDDLTKLNNMTKLMEDMRTTFVKFKKNCMHTLVYIDILNFKFVNENLGRNTGDIYLCFVADTLKRLKPANANIYRVGGDEFAIFFKNCVSNNKVTIILNKIFKALNKQLEFNNIKLSLDFSAGIACYPEHAVTADSMLYKAEVAMIEAKKKGANKHILYKRKFEEEVFKRTKLIEEIKEALKTDAFKLLYQPQVKKIDDQYKIIGVEALIRWQLPTGELLSPAHFIDIAEKSNQIIEIGKFVIFQALNDIGELKSQYGKDINVAINVSVNQFLDKGLIQSIKEEIEASGLNPKYIEIELTERMLVNTIKNYESKIQDIKKLGINISIDDFGVEYSSLNYLKMLPIDKIKLDMSFVHGIGKNTHDEAILESLIQLCSRLNLEILAEGIETAEQLEFLEKISDNLNYQGYYFYKPMLFKEMCQKSMLDKMLRNN